MKYATIYVFGHKYILCNNKTKTRKDKNKEMEEEKLNVKQQTPAGRETS